jgi:hypothetical protein
MGMRLVENDGPDLAGVLGDWGARSEPHSLEPERLRFYSGHDVSNINYLLTKPRIMVNDDR